jgi:hypothetical protein
MVISYPLLLLLGRGFGMELRLPYLLSLLELVLFRTIIEVSLFGLLLGFPLFQNLYQVQDCLLS